MNYLTIGTKHFASSFDTSRAWDCGYDQSDVQDNSKVFDLPCLSHRALSLTGCKWAEEQTVYDKTHRRHSAHAISPRVRFPSLLLLIATSEDPAGLTTGSSTTAFPFKWDRGVDTQMLILRSVPGEFKYTGRILVLRSRA